MNVDQKVIELENKIKNLELDIKSTDKEIQELEINKRVLENETKEIENTLSSEFDIDNFDENTIKLYIEKLEKEILEEESKIIDE